MQDLAVDRKPTLACVVKCKFYARILCTFSISSDKIKKELHVLCDILTPVAFWLACFLNSFDYL